MKRIKSFFKANMNGEFDGNLQKDWVDFRGKTCYTLISVINKGNVSQIL